MSASPSAAEISRKLSAACRCFSKKVSYLVPELAFRADGKGKYVARKDGISVIIHGKAIRASNGEVAGWPIANVISGSSESVFYSPPWLEGGCSVEAVVGAYRHYASNARS